MTKLSFVIPCYRSEKTIENVVKEIKETVSSREGYAYEVICVNDCSPDGVYDVLERLAAEDKNVKVINFAKNMGKHSAVLAGYHYVTGQFVVNLDDDMQSPVPELWKLIDPLENDECDVATAEYYEKKQAGWKNFGSAVNMKVGEILLEKPKNLRIENFSAIKRFVAEEMIRYENPYPYLEGLILRVTSRIKVVKMEERERGDGNTTGYTFKKSLALFANGFTAFSVKPLRIATFTGVLAAFAGFVGAIITVIRRLIGSISIAGYASTMVIQLILGGLILMCLGLLGEYIGRIYISLNKAPQYVVRNTINTDSD